MVSNNGEVLHFALTVLIISAENSVLKPAVPVMTGVTIILSHLSMETEAKSETNLPANKHQLLFTTLFTQFAFYIMWHLLYSKHHF